MIVYIKKGIDDEIANPNFYAAYDGFKQLGFEIRYFRHTKELTEHKPEDLVVGYVNGIRRVLARHGIVTPEIDYPEELSAYLERKVWITKLSAVANAPDSWGIFVKPVEDKKFTGVVVRGTKDLVGCGTYGEDPEVFCSEIVNFVSEWRCFVRYGRILDVRPYRGDWRQHFDASVLEEMVERFESAPKGYSIDIGLTDQGRTLLIEVNDGYALGHYGLNTLDYAKLLSARWAELTGIEDECDF
ncbi:hypothetical protein CDO73_03165 [Saccharibacillus sp. O23]|uniref:ATP-grasp domain-containing protein n=1 Tax=Saccharibacillus sp. O23 TaxID=2009338 RepID=UPI000B4E65C9|nr:ATP-grasp domain-containing protein [Saccharibacillus sp. O23]OWR32615.1 hypothetical protein CDO73_03165 [Saccharibacillus sp. O23]